METQKIEIERKGRGKNRTLKFRVQGYNADGSKKGRRSKQFDTLTEAKGEAARRIQGREHEATIEVES